MKELMVKELMERLRWLAEDLEKLAQAKAEESRNLDKVEWLKGYYEGRANAYSLAAMWVKEITEDFKRLEE